MNLALIASLVMSASTPAVRIQDASKGDATAADLIAATFKRYYDARSLSGRIHLTQTAQNVTVSIDTEIAYDRPSKLYLFQRRTPPNAQQWLATSNGNIFSYDKPPRMLGPARLREPVSLTDGRVQTVPEMYAALGDHSLGDRSPVLDIAIASPAVLADLKAHWGSIRRGGTVTVRDKTAEVITGDYCAIVGRQPTGAFELDLSSEGDVLRYILKNRYGIPDRSGRTVDVISTWDADLKIGTTNDAKLYNSG